MTRQHKWLCAGGPATRWHKGPFLLAQSCWRVPRPPAKPVLAARTNHFWPSVKMLRVLVRKREEINVVYSYIVDL
jgi:hypothetical protein